MEDLTEVLLNKNIKDGDTVAADFDKKEGKIISRNRQAFCQEK